MIREPLKKHSVEISNFPTDLILREILIFLPWQMLFQLMPPKIPSDLHNVRKYISHLVMAIYRR